MSVLDLVNPAATTDRSGLIAEFFETRAADVDTGRAAVRDGLAYLGSLGFAEADLADAISIIATVARSDMASAFSAWAHRMTIDYVSLSPPGAAVRAQLPALATARTLGATALAAGTAHVWAGVPLPVTYREDGDDFVIDGRIPWASNLIAPFLVVSAAVHADDPSRTIVVALTHDTPGVEPAPHPDLLALDATGSTTVKLSAARVPRGNLITDDLHGFVDEVARRFLLLQTAFCTGLARRAYAEASANLGPMGDALRPQLDALAADLDGAEADVARLTSDATAGRPIERAELFALRLRWTELASQAVHLELAATGGRGYLVRSGTARRVREAAFLPIQAPTEVLLRWLLSRSA